MRMLVAILAVLLSLIGPAFAEKITLRGDVTYRERIALPSGGALTVALVDLATPNLPRVTAKAPIEGPGQVPLTFTLGFDESIILPGHAYALDAEITGEDGTLWFRTAEPYPVDPANPDASILIVVSRAPEPKEPPVVPTAVPDQPSPSPLLNVTWQARTIGGNPVARNVVSSLSIAPDMRAGGRGGCNSWFAQADVSGDRLLFSAVAATRMACLSGDATAQEDSFFAALAATRFWRVDNERLTLLDNAGAELVVMEKSRF